MAKHHLASSCTCAAVLAALATACVDDSFDPNEASTIVSITSMATGDITTSGTSTSDVATDPDPTAGDPTSADTGGPGTTTLPDDTTTLPDDTSSTGVDTDGFDPQGAFGDDEFGVQELDLVGRWGLWWDPTKSPWQSELTIEPDGGFVWRETTDDCRGETLATGTLWVEGYAMVMHVDTWERDLPFATMDALGEEFPPPFRLRLGYTLQGLYLGLAAPTGITTPEPYAGRTWARYFADDDWLAGEWQLEAELTAIPAGEQQAIVIVREVHQALLDPAFNTTPVEGSGQTVHSRTFWGADPPKADPAQLGSGDYVCVGACDQPAGAASIDGEYFVYGPYAGAQRLMSFASGRAFQRDTPPACE